MAVRLVIMVEMVALEVERLVVDQQVAQELLVKATQVVLDLLTQPLLPMAVGAVAQAQ
jgi:hypothetical protein